MEDVDSLCHTKWECKYHVVFIPKYRRKALFALWLRRAKLGSANAIISLQLSLTKPV
jgi:REP element-mobilizing transposase RayT